MKKHTLLELLQIDQENIRKISSNKISKEEFEIASKLISNSFLTYLSDEGFPFKDVAPNDVYKAAIVLARHLDPSRLETIFADLKDMGVSKIDPQHKAYFIDKIRVYKGKAQIYGTQFKRDSEGKIVFLPIEDEINVNDRRRDMGMSPLEEYKKSAEVK